MKKEFNLKGFWEKQKQLSHRFEVGDIVGINPNYMSEFLKCQSRANVVVSHRNKDVIKEYYQQLTDILSEHYIVLSKDGREDYDQRYTPYTIGKPDDVTYIIPDVYGVWLMYYDDDDYKEIKQSIVDMVQISETKYTSDT